MHFPPLLSELLDFINALGAMVSHSFHSFHPLEAPTPSIEECLVPSLINFPGSNQLTWLLSVRCQWPVREAARLTPDGAGGSRRSSSCCTVRRSKFHIHPIFALGRLLHLIPHSCLQLFLWAPRPSSFPSAAPAALDFQQVTQQLPHNHDDHPEPDSDLSLVMSDTETQVQSSGTKVLAPFSWT